MNNKGRLSFNPIAMFSLALVVFACNQAGTQAIDPEIFNQLEYRHIGPPGNRVSAVAGVPGDPRVYYAGNPAGGIHKSIDGGITWFPIFDDQEVPFIGEVAVAPSDPNIVWAGTGEIWFRNNNKYLPIGNGAYKSTDAGETWTHMGLDRTGRIGRIVIHPENPDIVFVAAMGHSYGPQEERGVYRTQDGGETWERVLFVNPDTGASDVAMVPGDPDKLSLPACGRPGAKEAAGRAAASMSPGTAATRGSISPATVCPNPRWASTGSPSRRATPAESMS